jgi:hypothetical protein
MLPGMIDSVARRNILHLASELNNVAVAIKVRECCLKDGEEGREALSKLLRARETLENLPPKFYADPHRSIYKFLSLMEKSLIREKLKPLIKDHIVPYKVF